MEIKPLVDDPCPVDQLGREEAVDALAHLINSIDQKANSSFTIGVFGDWGTGKTSILKQVQKKLEEDSDDKPLIVWFNPWQFSTKDNILASLFMAVADAIEQQTQAEKGIVSRSSDKVKGFASRLKDVATAFAARSELEVSVPFLANMKFSGASWHESTVTRSNNETPMTELKNMYSSLYFDVLNAIAESASQISRKIVILVDDLDRCDHENIITLFDGMKVFFDIPNFVFVLGAAQEVVRSALKKKGTALGIEGDAIDEMAYLDKIIQFGYVIPPPDPLLLKENIIGPVLQKYEIDASYSDLVLEIIDRNPRTIKRLLNHFIFAHFVLEKRLGEPPVSGVVLKSALISYQHRNFFTAVQPHANVFLSLEEKIINAQSGVTVADDSPTVSTDNGDVMKTLNNKVSFDLVRILGFRPNEETFGQITHAQEYLFGSSLGGVDAFIEQGVENSFDGGALSPMEGFNRRFLKIDPIKVMLGNERYGQFEHTSTATLYVDKFPMTAEIYHHFMPENATSSTPGLPVTSVSWREAAQFCNLLSERYGREPVYSDIEGQPEVDYQKDGFRLLTEAEWESIARSGMNNDAALGEVAWFSSNSSGGVRSTGTKAANTHGMYDMLGNVWEWVNDWSGKYPDGSETDWRGQESGFEKLARGGSWANFASAVTPDYRSTFDIEKRDDNIGFRICTITPIGER